MIGLKDYIEKDKYIYPSVFGHTFDKFMEVNGVNEDTVTEDMMNWYASHLCDKRTFSHPAIFCDECMQKDEYLTEMLKSTTIEVLLKQINKALGANKEKSVKIYKEDDLETKNHKDVYRLLVPQEIYDKDKISDVCEKMAWQWTSVKINFSTLRNPFIKGIKPVFIKYDNYGEGRYAYITIEPLQSEKRTLYVQSYCDGIVYHLCYEADVKSILKSGLRIKGEDNRYRFIKDRVYFICGTNKDQIFNAIRRVAISMDMWDYAGETLERDTALLKIDVSDYNIDFYMDKMYESEVRDNVVYAYGYFPPKMITKTYMKNEFPDNIGKAKIKKDDKHPY